VEIGSFPADLIAGAMVWKVREGTIEACG